MAPIFAGCLVVMALGYSGLSYGADDKMERRDTVVDASFELHKPLGWAIERRAGGVAFIGPTAEGIAALIFVRYVPPDYTLYDTPESYMERMTRPSSIPLQGWKNGEVEKVKIAGRTALRLERDTTEFTAPHSVAPTEVAIREEHLAVASERGFYLLIYTAPRSIDLTQRPVFRKLTERNFKPKR